MPLAKQKSQVLVGPLHGSYVGKAATSGCGLFAAVAVVSECSELFDEKQLP